ncbi:hypothetical protein Acr_06g0006650 [Actinidia rufa]|uniref:Retrotransposon Copia-like N-terminal domain-containing protein n=1 Tax=Actinidia rufa TaxID=165716 RepID=A0A7J0EQF4_9ERIC|nr:hypothetical protein Acr_06g0006650 [Actinidia rufa]
MASRVPESSEVIESSLAPVALTPRPDLSLSQRTLAHCVISVLLNGNNFSIWSRSFRLFLDGKGKTGWIMGQYPMPTISDPTYPQWDIDNCTILGWLFNSMEDRIDHIEIARASQETLGLSVADYFGFLQSRYEELAQYEPLSDFLLQLLPLSLSDLIILNTSPLPSLYEAFAIIDGDEHRRRLIQASPAISLGSTPIADQLAFATSDLGPRSSGGRPICSCCGNIGHIREQCFKLHPELKGTSSKCKGKGPPRTTTVAETSPSHVPDLSHIQSQLGLLQSQLGSLLQQQPLGSTATLATSTPTAFHAKTGIEIARFRCGMSLS